MSDKCRIKKKASKEQITKIKKKKEQMKKLIKNEQMNAFKKGVNDSMKRMTKFDEFLNERKHKLTNEYEMNE